MIKYSDILSDNVKSLAPSGIRKFFDILEEMTDAISLGIGEPDFVTPWHIRDAGIRSLEKGFTKYTGNAGLTQLRGEISKYLIRRFELEYDHKEQIIVTVGGSEAIDLAIRALVNPGEEIIIPVPSFVCYGPITSLAGGTPIFVETKAENEFRLTADELKKAISPKTKLLILPYPCNPTGAIMERKDLEAVAEVLRETNIMVLSDEIYAELTYGGRHVSIANIPGMYERTIYVGGFSKSHAMTGWRMGYACGPADIIRQMLKIHQYAVMSSPTTSQYAAIQAMSKGDNDVLKMKREYDGRRRYLYSGLRDIGLPCFEPRGAFYMFPSIKATGLSSAEFCERLLLAQKVAVIPGSAFGAGGEGFVRICYASSMENITLALLRIGKFIAANA
ncbi:MAG: aminotransferase class I/II-fold pyridoxal phosphate-dependent enzyme [Oscillospiraceae bacterium]|nr:aminotransferase class I/II-fold pyridoxal phosphate-dependent enzyme [Oscillospiraceae bacterium]